MEKPSTSVKATLLSYICFYAKDKCLLSWLLKKHKEFFVKKVRVHILSTSLLILKYVMHCNVINVFVLPKPSRMNKLPQFSIIAFRNHVLKEYMCFILIKASLFCNCLFNLP